jgi:hypothetical protein
MSKIACLFAVLCILPATAAANDRTEDGTAASRNVALQNDGLASTGVTSTAAFAVPYVYPAGSDMSEVLSKRLSRGETDTIEFLTIKRQGIEYGSHSD